MPPPGSRVARQVGEKIRARRTSRKLSLRQLAERTGVNFSQLAKIERGEMETTLERYGSIAMNLGCSLRDLFGAGPGDNRRRATG